MQERVKKRGTDLQVVAESDHALLQGPVKELGQEVEGEQRHPAADEDDHDEEEHLDGLLLVLHAERLHADHRRAHRPPQPQLEDEDGVAHALRATDSFRSSRACTGWWT